MPVTCPHCDTRYVLPQALLGPGGARVRCPRCREPFSVAANGEIVEPAEKSGTTPAQSYAPAEAVASGVAFLAAPSVAVSVSANVAPIVAEAEATATVVAAATTEPQPAPGPAALVPPADAARPPVEKSATPAEVANAVLDELATHTGDALRTARAEGRLFKEFGPVIAEAFEFYRREVGPGADPAPFRTALRDKWGVDLEPHAPQGRLG